MNKLITAILVLMLSSFTVAQAEIGLKIGLATSGGVFEATGTETEDSEKNKSEDAMGVFGYSSIFIEKTLPVISRVSIGYNRVFGTLESETQSNTRTDGNPSRADTTSITNTVQVDFTNFNTLYASLRVTDNFFIKTGRMSVDVTTNEVLGTGSGYGNTSLDGSMVGAGYHHDFDNGMFVRAEASRMEFDGKKLTSTATCVGTGCANNTITVDQLNGASAMISVGRSF
tara:strand:- start:647 stop:1330 length:684 start_codon:yes stop_codon:yes gene_type:complete